MSAHMSSQPIGILTHHQRFHTLLVMAAWFQLKIRFMEGIRSVKSDRLLQELYWRTCSVNRCHSISYTSTLPARYAEGITTANTCADQRCYHSKSFYSNRYYEVRLEIIRVGKLGAGHHHEHGPAQNCYVVAPSQKQHLMQVMRPCKFLVFCQQGTRADYLTGQVIALLFQVKQWPEQNLYPFLVCMQQTAAM